jgi:hypothetical protein
LVLAPLVQMPGLTGKVQGCHHSPLVRPDFRTSRLRFAFLSPGEVCGADPGSGLYEYPKRDFEVDSP